MFALGVLVFVVAGRLGRPTRVVAETTADNADEDAQDLQTDAGESDADDVVGTSVSEDESAEESTLEQFLDSLRARNLCARGPTTGGFMGMITSPRC